MVKIRGNSMKSGWSKIEVAKVMSQAFLLYLAKYNRKFLNLVRPNPFDVDIKSTERCNSRCVTCDIWKSGFKSRLRPEPATEEWEDIFCQLQELRVKTVGFNGGEPLLRNDIEELVRKAKEIVGAKVYILTNGLLLEKKAEALLKNGLDYVSISIDGIGKTNDTIRGVPGHYQKAIRGIQVLKDKSRDLGLNIRICNIGTTLTKSNISQVPELIELSKGLGASWSFNLLDTNQFFFNGVDSSELLIDDKESVDELISWLGKNSKELSSVFRLNPTSLEFSRKYLMNGGMKPEFNCVLGYFRVYIDSQMNVYSGCWVLEPVGNLRERKLADIINSEEYAQRARDMFDMKCPGCTCGYAVNCIINTFPSSLGYGIRNINNLRKLI